MDIGFKPNLVNPCVYVFFFLFDFTLCISMIALFFVLVSVMRHNGIFQHIDFIGKESIMTQYCSKRLKRKTLDFRDE